MRGSRPIEIGRRDRSWGRRHVDLVVVVNGFPRLSETFVLHELLELERQGVRLHLVALRRPEEAVPLEAVAPLQAAVAHLPESTGQVPESPLRNPQELVLPAPALPPPNAGALI